MTEYTGDSRFVRMDYGATAPAQCLVSGATHDLIDLGRTIPMYGRLYLSVDVVRELAVVAGITDSPVSEQAWNREKLEAFTREVTNVTDEFVDRLRLLGAAVDGSGRLVGASSDEKPQRKPRRNRKDAGGPAGVDVQPTSELERGTDSTGSIEGPDGVSGDSGNVPDLDDIRI